MYRPPGLKKVGVVGRRQMWPLEVGLYRSSFNKVERSVPGKALEQSPTFCRLLCPHYYIMIHGSCDHDASKKLSR